MHRFEFDSRPWVRWWWLQGPFRMCDIEQQLVWLRDNGFGGVELAWLCPLWRLHGPAEAKLPKWLGSEFSQLIASTKRCCDELELGCDFTFGSAWPFGGRCVPSEDASRTFDGPTRSRIRASWEAPEEGYVLDHLSARALCNYAKCMIPAFANALEGSTSALFCDSWEIRKSRLWSHGLWDTFEARFGYDLRTLLDDVESNPQIRYDHRKLVGETVVQEFYATFTTICREHGAVSRVQCHGSPTDLISAYSAVDIPETEAILYNPQFSRIPSSAAALSGKAVVSSETFTCLYGFPSLGNPLPRRLWRHEQIADLKLLADSLFAQGVNQIIWHGMPFNPLSEPGRIEFYASVHVAPDSSFRSELQGFNGYLERLGKALKQGRTLSNLAVYLPYEDEIIRGRLPTHLRVPGSEDHAEMRYVSIPTETEGYAPLWISSALLRQSKVHDRELCCGTQKFQALYVDVEWLDCEALEVILHLAEKGLDVILKRRPTQPGHRSSSKYAAMLGNLQKLAFKRLSEIRVKPLLRGDPIPWFWARRAESVTWLFFAHPKVRQLRYPMTYGQSQSSQTERVEVELNLSEWTQKIELCFAPYESVLLRIERDEVKQVDLKYSPPAASTGMP